MHQPTTRRTVTPLVVVATSDTERLATLTEELMRCGAAVVGFSSVLGLAQFLERSLQGEGVQVPNLLAIEAEMLRGTVLTVLERNQIRGVLPPLLVLGSSRPPAGKPQLAGARGTVSATCELDDFMTCVVNLLPLHLPWRSTVVPAGMPRSGLRLCVDRAS